MIKNPFNLKCLKIFSLIFFLSFLTSDLYAQCAGTSGGTTICLKETLNGGANGVIDLYDYLTGETAGGTWTEITALPCAFGGGGSLGTTTGLLNTWAIRKGCVYTYEYTAPAACGGGTSTVTITLGGYPGVGPIAPAVAEVCDDVSDANLFQFLGSNPNPDALFLAPFDGGGTFTCPDFPALISGNEFNATLPDPDAPDAFYPNYNVCYTVPATDTCPSRQTCFTVHINQKPEPGTTMSPYVLCETDYLTFPTAFDLQTLFNPTPVRDPGGDWSDETVPPFGNPVGGVSGPPYGSANGILNSGDSVINIRGIYDAYVAAFGHDASHTDQDIELTFEYTVYPTHPICNPEQKATFTIIIERVIDLNGSNITANPVGVCLNEATTTPIVMTINENPMYPVEDGTYDISYTLTGSNAAQAGGDATVPVTFSGGSGDITLNLTGAPVVGITQLCITNAVENDSQVVPRCSRAINPPVCQSFEVYAAPDPSDTQVSVNDICLGGTNTVTISDINPGNGFQLIDGTYSINYTLSCGGGASPAIVVITNGTGTFNLPVLPLDGTCTITLELFTNVTTTCESLPTTIANSFVVNIVPDGTLMTVNVDDECVGNTFTVDLAGITSAPDGSYTVTYTISSMGSFTDTVTLTGGSGSFTPSVILPVGIYTITITEIRNANCGTTVFITPSDTFEIRALPDATAMTIDVPDGICTGNSVTATVNGITPAGTYDITYTLTPPGTSNTATSVNGSGGTIDLGILAAGTYTITTSTIVDSSTGCQTTSNATDTFTILDLPIITSANVSATDICQNDPTGSIVTITGLADGNYNIDYSVSGTNIVTPTVVSINIAGGSGSFAILTGSSIPGANTITINSIVNTVTGCTAVLTGVQANFTVNPNPTLNQGELTVADVCLGNNAVGTITGALGMADGTTYAVAYTLTLANGGSSASTTTVIAGNSGTFFIPGLINPGLTQIEITQIVNATTGCSTSGLSVTAQFNVIPSVDVTPATATVPTPVCASSDVVVTIQTPLIPGVYTFDYILSNANGDGVTTFPSNVTIDATGQGTYTIPGIQLPNGGSTTVTMQNFSSGGCPSTGNFSVTFTVTETLPPGIVAGGDTFCIQNLPTIADLIANMTPAGGDITIYNAATGGVAYAPEDLLEHANTYYASLTENTCESETRFPVIVDLTACPDVIIPDGFSPNGDALNETFEIRFIDLLYPAYDLEIYNRYGAMVYKGNINTPKFNGKANQTTILGSDVMPIGVYFYILNYNDPTGKAPVQGRLYLSR